MKRGLSEVSHIAKQEKPKKMMKSTYVGDPRLVPRLQQVNIKHVVTPTLRNAAQLVTLAVLVARDESIYLPLSLCHSGCYRLWLV